MIFLFVVPEGYNRNIQNDSSVDEESLDYVCYVKDDAIEFHNFYNGTLLVMGDHLQKSKYFPEFTEKSINQINNPVKYDNFNVKKFIANFQNEYEEPQEIDDIIASETPNNPGTDLLKKIVITGNALNENYSVMTFYDVSAKTYVYNLSVKSSLPLKNDADDTLLISLNDNLEMPSNDKMIALYPLENDLKPIVGDIFKARIVIDENADNISSLSTAYNSISSAIDLISSNIYEYGGLLWSIDRFIDEMRLSSTLINSYVTEDDLNMLKASSKNLDIVIKSFDLTELKYDINGYIINEKFNTDSFNYSLSYVNSKVETIYEELSSFFFNGYLSAYIESNKSIASDSIFDASTLSGVDLFEKYKEKYYNTVSSLISSAISSMTSTQRKVIENLDTSFDSEKFALSSAVKTPEFNLIEAKGEYEQYIDFFGTGTSCSALTLSIDNGNYLSLNNNELNKYLFNMLFNDIEYPDFVEKHSSTSGICDSSKRGATICLWIKPNKNTINDDVAYFGFVFESIFKFIVNHASVKSHDGSKYVSLNNFYDEFYRSHLNQWQMLTVRLDNKNLNENKIGVRMDLWAYGKNADDVMEPIGCSVSSGEIASPLQTIVDGEAVIDKELIKGDTQMTIGLSKSNGPNGNESTNRFNGNLRNLTLFAGCLSDNEIKSYLSKGIQSSYSFPNEYFNLSIAKLIQSKNFYLGLIGIYNVSNINILNCVMKYDGKAYFVQ